jgi:hypothetical protein
MHKTLKEWLVENMGVEKDADDDTCKKAVGEAIASGKLTAEKLAELTADKDAEAVNALTAKLDSIADGLSKLIEVQAKAPEKPEEKEAPKAETKDVQPETKDAPKLPEGFEKAVGDIGAAQAEKDKEPRVKSVSESYSRTKSTATYPEHDKRGNRHPMAGMPMTNAFGATRTMETSSDLDKAVNGAYAQFLCATAKANGSRSIGYSMLPEHSKQLLDYALHEYMWGGATDGGDFADIKDRQLTPQERKALIDDSTSGGIEAAPIVFDDDVIQAPLLTGELFPLVKIVPLERGRRIEGVSIGHVTGSWGGVDDTSVALFNTAGFVSAFNTTIYRWEGSIRIGLDFLSDTPIDFGTRIAAQYGERLLEDLDDVIAVGNGTTQPEGVMNKSGVSTVAFGGTAATLGGYESLRFGVTKQEHTSVGNASAVFCGTETSYQRARAIPVGTSDARRLGGMDYSSYRWMERAYKLNGSLTNAQIFYAILARYRMYQRRGLTMRTSTEGDTLIRRNSMLMVATARYGGQLERAAAATLTTTAQA